MGHPRPLAAYHIRAHPTRGEVSPWLVPGDAVTPPRRPHCPQGRCAASQRRSRGQAHQGPRRPGRRAGEARRRRGAGQYWQRVETLTAELERLRAEGEVASGRDRDDLWYLFVVTYGRSGWTYPGHPVQHPGRDDPRRERRACSVSCPLPRHGAPATASGSTAARPLPATHPWWGIDGYPDSTALRGIRFLAARDVLRPDPATRVVGFKEIDWMHERMGEQLEFVVPSSLTRASCSTPATSPTSRRASGGPQDQRDVRLQTMEGAVRRGAQRARRRRVPGALRRLGRRPNSTACPLRVARCGLRRAAGPRRHGRAAL